MEWIAWTTRTSGFMVRRSQTESLPTLGAYGSPVGFVVSRRPMALHMNCRPCGLLAIATMLHNMPVSQLQPKVVKYVCITTYQQDTKSNPSPNATTKQHAIVNFQVKCATYPDKFIRENVVAPSVLLSVVIVTLSTGKSNPNPYPDHSTIQHAVVKIPLNIVTCPTYPTIFISKFVTTFSCNCRKPAQHVTMTARYIGYLSNRRTS